MRSRLALVALLWASVAHAQIAVPLGPNGGAAGGSGSGSVTSIATSCGVSGGTITTTGTIQGITTVNPQTGTNYPIVSGDCGKLVNLSNASNQIPTIPAGSTLGSGWFTEVCNQGAGTQTITPASGTIGGASTYVLAAGTAAAPKCVGLVSDGTNLQLDLTGIGGSGSSGANPSATASDTAVNGSASTFMRSDGAPAVQKGTNAQFGLAEGDNASISMTAGVASLKALTGDCTTSAGAVATTCRQTWPVYIVNNWYGAGEEWDNLPASTANVFNGTARCYPAYFHGPATVSALGARINATNGGNLQIAVYANNPATNRPTGTPLGSTANITMGVSGPVNAAVSFPVTGTPLLWWCMNSDNNVGTVNGIGLAVPAALIGSATQANIASGASRLSNVTTTLTFGTWGDLTSATFAEQTGFIPGLAMFKISSVP